ncbi:DUF262 domain-containing protein [Photobacterium carnosum]|uniref:GmrSD restriction endonuclease domain-containing protein n=1 Tax=Photobacterium carnosum TaxID=2023717 RepID=UPI001E57536A|nr:DUF262 domain-containing protein [Photobacterium carnosum]MCD9514221.1 hypothetical protein [Photobacterium carnosum]
MNSVRNEILRIKNYDISIGELQMMLRDGDFDLVPSFKEGLKWNIREKSKYVESALLQLPLNNILFEEDNVGKFIIVDGADRISALIDYMADTYELSNLPILSKLEGKAYSDLEYSDQLRLKRTVLSCDIISNDSNQLLKCEYLKRINLSNPSFLPQQARNFAFPKSHSLIKNEMENLIHHFNYSIIERSHGSRRHISINRAEQFFLCMILIQVIYYNGYIFNNTYLGNALDQLCYEIENKKVDVDVSFLFDNIQKVMDYLGFDSINLVYRSFSSMSKYKKNEISMNDFLCLFYEVSHGLKVNTLKFNFFNEDIRMSKLSWYI